MLSLSRSYLWFLAAAVVTPLHAEAPRDFDADVLPIFQRRCSGCHGAEKQKSGLRLDSWAFLQEGGDEGPSVVAGKGAASRLVQVLTGELDPRMPPKGEPLTAAEIETIVGWIDAGAVAPRPSAVLTGGLQPETVEPLAFETDHLEWWHQPVFDLASSRDGRRVAAAWAHRVGIRTLPVHSERTGEEGGDAPGSAPAERTDTEIECGHGFATALAFRPQGDLLAVGGYGAVELWSTTATPTDRPVRVLRPHAERVRAMAFSPDGETLYAAAGVPSRGGELKAWRVADGQLLFSSAEHSDTVLALAVSPDGKRLVTGGADRRIYLRDSRDGKPLERFFGHSHYVTALAFSADGEQIVSGGAAGEVKTWKAGSQVPTQTLRGHTAEVADVFPLEGGKRILSVAADQTLRLWDTEEGGETQVFEVEGGDSLYAAALLDHASVVAATGRDGVIRTYDLRTGEPREELYPVRGF